MKSSFKIDANGVIILDSSSEEEDNVNASDDEGTSDVTCPIQVQEVAAKREPRTKFRVSGAFMDDTTEEKKDDLDNAQTSCLHNNSLHNSRNEYPSSVQPVDKARELSEPSSTEKSHMENATVTSPGEPSQAPHRPMDLLCDRSKSCWVCSVALELPGGDFCLYSRYDHPLIPLFDESGKDEESLQTTKALAANVCVVCASKLVDNDNEAMDRETQASESDNDSNSEACTCALCLESEGDGSVFFLCDKCPRSFCGTCVALCHGGGEAGFKVAQKLQNSTGEWACPICDPPDSVYRKTTPTTNQPRLLEHAYAELEVVEQEHEDTLKILDNDSKVRDEIRDELERSSQNRKSKDEKFTEEVERWKDDM